MRRHDDVDAYSSTFATPAHVVAEGLEHGGVDVLQIAHRDVRLDAHAPAVVTLATAISPTREPGSMLWKRRRQRLAQRGHRETGRAVLDRELDDLRRARRRDTWR